MFITNKQEVAKSCASKKRVAYKRGRGPIRDKLLLYLACDWQNFHLENIQEVAKKCTCTKPFAHKGLSGPIRDKLFFYLACDWPKLHLENKHSGGGCKKGALYRQNKQAKKLHTQKTSCLQGREGL